MRLRRVAAAVHGARTLLRVRKLVRTSKAIKLEIGAGRKRGFDGWTTLDREGGADLRWNLGRRLPFPDASVDVLYSSHVLEHFHHADLMKLLADCRRVLKRGGVFLACVPDASIYLRAYFAPDAFDKKTFLQYQPAVISTSPIDLVNYIAYMSGEHRHMFDRENLHQVLTSAGFVAVAERAFDSGIDVKSRQYESIYVTATNP